MLAGRWRRVCSILDENEVWKAVTAEERKDVFEDVKFTLAQKEKVLIALAFPASPLAL